MKLRKTLTVMVAVSMVFMFAATFVVEARPFGPNFKNRGMRSELSGLKTYLELKLSDFQQTEMMNIIMKYQHEGESLRNSISEDRKNLSTVLHAEQLNEEDARKAFREVSAIREEMFILREKMRVELKSVLTPEQLELLKELKAQRLERGKHRLGAWLENPSE